MVQKIKVKSNPSLSWAWPSSVPACFLFFLNFLQLNLLGFVEDFQIFFSICKFAIPFWLSFLHTLSSIIFPTGNACVPAAESPPCWYLSIFFISFKTPNNHNNDFPVLNSTILMIRLVIRQMVVSWGRTFQGRLLSCCQGFVLGGDGDPGASFLASIWQNGSCGHHSKCGKQMLSQINTWCIKSVRNNSKW